MKADRFIAAVGVRYLKQKLMLLQQAEPMMTERERKMLNRANVSAIRVYGPITRAMIKKEQSDDKA